MWEERRVLPQDAPHAICALLQLADQQRPELALQLSSALEKPLSSSGCTHFGRAYSAAFGEATLLTAPSNKRVQLTKRGLRLGGRFRGSAGLIESRFAADPRCWADLVDDQQ